MVTLPIGPLESMLECAQVFKKGKLYGTILTDCFHDWDDGFSSSGLPLEHSNGGWAKKLNSLLARLAGHTRMYQHWNINWVRIVFRGFLASCLFGCYFQADHVGVAT